MAEEEAEEEEELDGEEEEEEEGEGEEVEEGEGEEPGSALLVASELEPSELDVVGSGRLAASCLVANAVMLFSLSIVNVTCFSRPPVAVTDSSL